MPSSSLPSAPLSAWPTAVRLVAQWLDRRERVDLIMESLPKEFSGAERARCQNLVFGAIRHASRIEVALSRLITHAPRFSTRAVLHVAGYELIEAGAGRLEDGQVAKIVHHAVEQAKTLTSPAEARLVNAVVRKLATGFHTQPPPTRISPPEVLAEYYSHPEWLVRRWLPLYGADATRKLLVWNQKPPAVYARWRHPGEPVPEWLKKTEWPDFYEVPSGRWAELEPFLKNGDVYLQNPGTRLAVELLAPKPKETVLDLCSAPGGKSMLIADTMRSGRLVAVDLPGARVDRLKQNLASLDIQVALVQTDILKGTAAFKEHELPVEYSAVLIDVPCSNSGVMSHRVDVKWRLESPDFAKHSRQQGALLRAAARMVAPGGRLVYSTCSIDPEENEGVVKAFLKDNSEHFSLEGQRVSYPWESGHDGAGAFLLVRR